VAVCFDSNCLDSNHQVRAATTSWQPCWSEWWRCGVVWCGVVWCGVVWCGVVWCGSAVQSISLHHTTTTSLEYNQSQAMGLACCCCNQIWGQRGCLRVNLSQLCRIRRGQASRLRK
jgi:hypothetical protein